MLIIIIIPTGGWILILVTAEYLPDIELVELDLDSLPQHQLNQQDHDEVQGKLYASFYSKVFTLTVSLNVGKQRFQLYF